MSTSSFYNTTGPDSSQVTAIEGSVSSAADSAAAAEAAKVAAQSSASQAAASSNVNATSAAASEASKVAAQVAENNAETAETNAAASSAAALVSKNASAASAVASEASKVTSVNNAATATTKAAEASTSETNAAASAATATTKAADSETARAASVVAKDASVVAKNESVVAKDASVVAKNAAVAAQAAAETAETNAETAETNSASSASAASASASTASTKASEASTSAAASETSKVASEAAKDAALAALDSFDDRYLGSKANAPTVDNDGDALAAGMLYFNTTTDEMKVYDGSQWLNAYASLSGALLATGNLSDLNNAATARANLGLGTAATTPSTDYATAAQGTTADAALPRTGGAMTGAITTNSTFDGRDVATDGTKLDGIETAATADQTDAEIRAAVEAATDSNVFTDADHSKLDGIEAGATADQTAAEIKTAYESNADTNAFTDADESKLDGIEASADVTDAINVEAAGGLMDSELTSIASVKALNQGVATTDSPTFAGLTTSADISFGDSDKAIFGAGSDLQIYHDGSASRIVDAGAGGLTLQADANVVIQNSAGTETKAEFTTDGAVNLYHNNAAKLATTSTGIDVTGTATMDGGSISGNLLVGASSASAKLTVGTFGDTARAAQFHGGSILIDGGAATDLIMGDGNVAYMSLQTTDNTTAMKIRDYSGNADLVTVERASGNVGINETVPFGKLHISDTQTGRTTAGSVGNLLVLEDDENGMSILSADAGAGYILFGDTASASSGGITYDHSANKFNFRTNDAWNRMILDSSGNLLLGVTTAYSGGKLSVNGGIVQPSGVQNVMGVFGTSGLQMIGQTGAESIIGTMGANEPLVLRTASAERSRLDSSGNWLVGTTSTIPFTFSSGSGAGITSGGTIMAGATAEAGLFNRVGSDGAIIQLYKAGGIVGSIGTLSGTMYIGNGDCNLLFTGASDAILPVGTNGATKDGQLDLGSSGNRLKDIYLSGAAKSQAAELEDIKAKDTNGLNLQTSNGQKRVVLDNSGNVLVGKTATSQTTAGTVLYNNGQVYATASGTQASVLTRLSSDGPIQIFYKDSSEVGRIFSGHGGTQVGIGTNTTGITFNPSTRSMMPANPSSTNPQLDATLDIGFSSVRWRDLYLSGGVYLGGTGAANKLDDYEEGTWTPTFLGSGTNPTVTYAAQSGIYTKVGNLVTCTFVVGTSANSGGVGNIRIAGLPFAQSSNAANRSYSCINSYNYVQGTDGMQLSLEGNTSVTYWNLLQSRTGGSWFNPVWQTNATSGQIYFSGTVQYQV